MTDKLWLRAGLALLVGVIGGLLFDILHLPLPWLLGSLCLSTIFALAGAPVEICPSLRRYLAVILGVILGSTFSPEIIARIEEWIVTLLASTGYLFIITLVAQLYCRFVLKMDRITAVYSGLPGGLSEMAILGEEQGADMRMLTLTHATRVAAVLLVIPLFLTYWTGLDGQTLPVPETVGSKTLGSETVWSETIQSGTIQSETVRSKAAQSKIVWSGVDTGILFMIAFLGYFGGKLIRLPAHALTGPMLISAAAHLSGLITTEPPLYVSVIIQLAIGSALGARFCGLSVLRVGRVMLLALGMALLMMVVTIVSASVLSSMTGLSFEALVLALAPGGFAEMALAALSMNIDPAFVTTHHGLRLILIVFIMPIILSRSRMS